MKQRHIDMLPKLRKEGRHNNTWERRESILGTPLTKPHAGTQKKKQKNKEHQAPAGNNQTEPYGRRHWHNIFKEKIKGKFFLVTYALLVIPYPINRSEKIIT